MPVFRQMPSTVIVARMSHRKWRETKQQLIWWPSRARSGSAWLLISFSQFPVRHPGAEHDSLRSVSVTTSDNMGSSKDTFFAFFHVCILSSENNGPIEVSSKECFCLSLGVYSPVDCSLSEGDWWQRIRKSKCVGDGFLLHDLNSHECLVKCVSKVLGQLSDSRTAYIAFVTIVQRAG